MGDSNSINDSSACYFQLWLHLSIVFIIDKSAKYNHNFPEPKVTNSNCLLCPINCTKPEVIPFKMIWNQEKQQIPTFLAGSCAVITIFWHNCCGCTFSHNKGLITQRYLSSHQALPHFFTSEIFLTCSCRCHLIFFISSFFHTVD